MNCHRFNFQTAKEDPVVTVIASEAKQSIKPQRKYGLLRRFAPRNDGAPSAEAVAPSRREAPEALMKLPPKEGVGNAGCPLHPRPRVHFVLVERTRVTTSTPESPGIPARNGFNGLCRALVSAKSARMWERAVLTNRPLLDLSPFVLEGL
jgi:hypothetical protein